MSKITIKAAAGDRTVNVIGEYSHANPRHVLVSKDEIAHAAKMLFSDYSRVVLIPPGGFDGFERGEDGQFAYVS